MQARTTRGASVGIVPLDVRLMTYLFTLVEGHVDLQTLFFLKCCYYSVLDKDGYHYMSAIVFLLKLPDRYQQIHTNKLQMMPLATNIQQCYCSDYFPHSGADDERNGTTTTSGGCTESWASP